MVEYALLAGLIAVVAATALSTLGQTIRNGALYVVPIVAAAGH